MKEDTTNEDPTANAAHARMSAADAAHWDEIQQWKEAQISPLRPRVISQRLRAYAMTPVRKAVRLARKVPGGAAIASTMSSSALRLMEKATSVSEASVRRERILKSYREAGYDVERLEDIRSLGLSLNQIRPVRPHLKIAYSSAVAIEGALSGVVATGGSVAAVLGLGIISAPGIAITAFALALDIVTFLGAATRLVSHTAAYYGYDTVDPAENHFATMVLSQAIDPKRATGDQVVEKQTTMIAVNKVVRDIAKQGPMDAVGTNAISAAVNPLVASLGSQLAGMKVAQIVPFIGILVGAFLNASLMRTIGDTADHLYRERFLAERYGYIDEAGEDSSGVVSDTTADEISADIAHDAELAQKESPQL